MESKLTELLTSDDVTRILKIDLRTLYRMINARRIPAVKVGGRWRFRREELLKWLESAAITPARPPKRILVADHDEETREAIVRTLLNNDRQFYHIRAVGDGYGLLCELQRADFDLVLLDLGVPDLDGIQLLKQARKLRPALKAIVMTDSPSLKGAVEAADLGVGGYLQKPVERDELLGCVEKALGAGVG